MPALALVRSPSSSAAAPAPRPPAAAPLELRLSLADARGTRTDIVVSATTQHTVGELVEATRRLPRFASAGGELWCERRGRRLDPKLALRDAGILWGDLLVMGPGTAERERIACDAQVEVVVTGGPCSGRRIELGPGRSTIGRGAECEVQLADPSLSRTHLLVEVTGATVRVADVDSSNGTAVDGVGLAKGHWRLLRAEDHVEIGRTLLRFEPKPKAESSTAVQRAGRLGFNRPPRVARPLAPLRIELKAPPGKPGKVRLPMAMCLVPAVAGVVMFIVLNSAVMLIFCAMSPMMAIGTYVSDRRGGRRKYRDGAEEFRRRVARAELDIAAAAEGERRNRLIAAPDAAALAARATHLRTDLWERTPADADFMALRVGIADLSSTAEVKMQQTGDEALLAEAAEKLSANRILPAVPLVLDGKGGGAIGLCGSRPRVEAMARWLAIQAATLHSPADVVLCAAVAHDAAPDWEWLKWLPHAHGSHLVRTEAGLLVHGDIDTHALLSAVRELQSRRHDAQAARMGRRGRDNHPHVLMLLDEDVGIDRSLIGELLTDAPDTGVTVIWMGRDRRDLPGRCGTIVELESERATLAFTAVAEGRVEQEVSADGVELAVAERVSRALAPVQDVGGAGHAAEIPRRAALLDLIKAPDATEIARRWRNRDGRLTAVLGAAAGGPLEFDLRGDGPHALIVGTTGAGKSELLRTLVASMAVAHPPDRLSFLLVDYKGGAAFAPCAGFPHVVDVVSDLDEHIAQRALVSLEAELKRREQILATTKAKDLVELERRDPASAPPALVIAVDEFARLREEVPAFIDGVVDIAQRGRSLGVHMILAAQSVRSAFTPAVRANTNLRVALRVAEDGDSEDVISARDAARIPSGEAFRGRGYARTGHGELTEFQAAYVSGRSRSDEHVELGLHPFELGRIAAGAGEERYQPAADTDTDLTELALATTRACELLDIGQPDRPWLPLLPATLALTDLPQAPGVAIGLIDDPRRQRQLPLELDLPHTGNTVVFGAGRSGKSTLLRTVAAALARSASPAELQLYALESAGRGLQVLAELPHCGAVVTCGDGERVERLMARLVRMVDERARLLAEQRATTIDELASPPPRVVLLLDELGAFAEEYDIIGSGNPYELLGRIMSAGRAVGVHVLATADRRNALRSALAPSVGRRLILRMPTEDDLVGLGLVAREIRGVKLEPGRGFTQEGLEIQVALPGAGASGEDQFADIARLAGELRDRHSTIAVPAIDALTDAVARAALPPCHGPVAVPLGIGGHDLAPLTVDLSELHFMIVGPYRSGRTTALETLARGLAAAASRPDLYLLAPRRTSLLELDVWTRRARGPAACAEAVAELLALVESRSPEAPGEPVIVVVDDSGELTDMTLSAQMERIVRLGRDVNVRVLAAVETTAARGIGMPWLRELRKEGHGLLLRPDSGDGDVLGAVLPRRTTGGFPCGRGFLLRGGQHSLIQVAS